MSRRLRITTLLPIFVGIASIFALSIYGFVNIRTASKIAEDQLIRNSRKYNIISADLLFHHLEESDTETINNLLDEFVLDDEILYTAVRDTTSNMIADARVQGWLPPGQEIKLVAQQSFSQQQLVEYETQNALIITGPIVSGNSLLGTLEIAYDLTQIQEAVRNMTINMVFSGLGIFLVVLLISIFFIRYAIGQLQKVVDSAKEIGQGNLDAEVPEIGVEEIAILGETLDNTRRELKKLYSDYQDQVYNLQTRTEYLEATAVVARDTISILDQQELLSRVVNLINEKFNYYLQAIFLLDDTREWAIMKAVSGEGSFELSTREIRLRVGLEGIVGQVASTGELYVSQDVSTDPYFAADVSPKITSSELVFPLLSRGEIIGVLDIQSKKKNAFNNEEIRVLQTLADQLAIAISNAKLFFQSQENYKALQIAYGQIDPEMWRDLLRGETRLGYYCDDKGVISLEEIPGNAETDGLPELELPIVMRGGQVVGIIKAHKTSNEEDWDLEEISVMETLVDQLSVALESARLFKDTQLSATREQLLGDITSKIRETMDIETILRTATEEIRKSLKLPEVSIKLGQIESEPQTRS